MEQFLGDQHEHDDRENADDGGGDAPAERVFASARQHAQADQPFAKRRMHDKRRIVQEDVDFAAVEQGIRFGGPLRLVAEVHKSPRILHIEGLIKNQRRRMPEAHQSRERRDHQHYRRPSPPEPPLEHGISRRPPVIEAGTFIVVTGCVRR